MNKIRTLLLILLSAVIISVSSGVRAQSGGAPMHFPGSTNALMTIDVAKIMQSPLAKQLEWQSKLMKGQADRPFAMPASAKKVTIGASLNPAGMQAIWQAAIIELPSTPRFDSILKAQGGYLDQIGGKNAAWTPKDVFYVELAPNTLGIVRPGQRQYVSRWVSGKTAGDMSAYLKNAQAKNKDDAMFALDLTDVVSLTAIRYVYSLGDLPSLESMNEGRQKLLGALASVQGMNLSMKVTDKITGKLVVDFAEDVSGLGANAGPFVIDVLKASDLYEPTADQWQFKVAGKQIVGEGTMAVDVFGRLVALLSPPNDMSDASDADGATPAAGGDKPDGAAPAASKNDAASASQKYYKVVSGILDSLAAKASPSQSATWLVSKARVIEQLPILNVDPDLHAWGNSIAEALNRAAQELAIGQQKAQVAALGVASPTGYTTYNEAGGGNDTPETRAAFRNAQDQRRQVAQAERGAAAQRTLDIFNQILPTRGKIRAQMTQKYGVEF